jgi:hypothetical protein
MADSNVLAFGLTRAQLMEQDTENAERMVPLNTKDRGTPYEPVGPPAPVRRGATCEGCSDFIRRAEDACRRLT